MLPKVKQLDHGEGEASVSKTTFFVGIGRLKDSNVDDMEPRSVWITCKHGAGDDDGELNIHDLVSIRISSSKTLLDAKCVYVDELSDMAIILAPVVPSLTSEDALVFGKSPAVCESVYVAGYGVTVFGSEDPAVLCCLVAHEEAGPKFTKKHDKVVLTDTFHRWRSNRFFLVDRVVDFGFSGAPVINARGQVVGMLCASEYVGVSWVLKRDFMKDDIIDVIEFV